MEPLLAALQPRLYRFSMSMCRHPEDAEDVLQESMLAVARSAHSLRATAALSTWLYTIARRFCLKKRRKSKFAPSQEESLDFGADGLHANVAATTPLPDEQVAQLALWERVQLHIRALSPELREVLVLRDVEGLTAKEVAGVVGLTVAAVKSRLHRARSELRDRLATPHEKPQDCPQIRLVFSQFLEGELSADVCSTMQDHVASCAVCSAECEGLKSALTACTTAPANVPPDVQRRVQQALQNVLQTADAVPSPPPGRSV